MTDRWVKSGARYFTKSFARSVGNSLGKSLTESIAKFFAKSIALTRRAAISIPFQVSAERFAGGPRRPGMAIVPSDRSDSIIDREVIEVGPAAERRRRASLRWAIMLVVYMRTLAVLWMLLGLVQWSNLLLPAGPTVALPEKVDTTSAILAVIDVTAAAGLWLANPWGGVLWLVTAFGEALAALLLPGYPNGGWLTVSLYAPLILIYFVLTYMASRETEIHYGGRPQPLLRRFGK
jgi:hypothetical protein